MRSRGPEILQKRLPFYFTYLFFQRKEETEREPSDFGDGRCGDSRVRAWALWQ